MDPAELIKQNNPHEALKALTDQVRSHPADPDARLFLFQLFCILGEWDRAVKQLAVLAGMKKEYEILARVYRELLVCEKLRSEVFAGRRQPLIFGEPETWMGPMISALEMSAKGEHDAAEKMRAEALEGAEAFSGKIGDTPFEWLADGDSRLGPVLEMMLDGKYYWAPFSHILSIEIDAPRDLRDMVWAPASFKWTNGGETGGAIPVRYAESIASADGAVLMARKTDWEQKAENTWFGLGMRTFITDQADYPLYESLKIEFDHPELPDPPEQPESPESA